MPARKARRQLRAAMPRDKKVEPLIDATLLGQRTKKRRQMKGKA